MQNQELINNVQDWTEIDDVFTFHTYENLNCDVKGVPKFLFITDICDDYYYYVIGNRRKTFKNLKDNLSDDNNLFLAHLDLTVIENHYIDIINNSDNLRYKNIDPKIRLRRINKYSILLGACEDQFNLDYPISKEQYETFKNRE